MFDGSTVSMPDTEANQQAYPQLYNQKPGVGFPDRPDRGDHFSCLRSDPQSGNLPVCRQRPRGSQLAPPLVGHVFVRRYPAGRCSLMANWTELVLLKQRGVDCVSRLNKARRTADFRRGKRLGKGDHIVRWRKPPISVRGPADLQLASRVPHSSRTACSRGAARLSDEVDHRGDDSPGSTSFQEDLALLYRAAGTTSSISARSRRRCRWTSCAVNHRNWFTRRSGLMCWPIT